MTSLELRCRVLGLFGAEADVVVDFNEGSGGRGLGSGITVLRVPVLIVIFVPIAHRFPANPGGTGGSFETLACNFKCVVVVVIPVPEFELTFTLTFTLAVVVTGRLKGRGFDSEMGAAGGKNEAEKCDSGDVMVGTGGMPEMEGMVGMVGILDIVGMVGAMGSGGIGVIDEIGSGSEMGKGYSKRGEEMSNGVPKIEDGECRAISLRLRRGCSELTCSGRLSWETWLSCIVHSKG